MSAEPMQTSDVIGLTKVAPFSRRGFMTATAAVTAGCWPPGRCAPMSSRPTPTASPQVKQK